METTTQTTAGGAAGQSRRSLWRNRDYLTLWWTETMSTVGTQASAPAFLLLIFAVTGSPVQAGLLGAIRGLPYLLFGLVAGGLVDRWNRKLVLLACDAGRALALGSIPVALALGGLTAAHLYAVAFVEGTLFIFFGLASTAALRAVVSPAHLPTAVAQGQATAAAAGLAGPALGGRSSAWAAPSPSRWMPSPTPRRRRRSSVSARPSTATPTRRSGPCGRRCWRGCAGSGRSRCCDGCCC